MKKKVTVALLICVLALTAYIPVFAAEPSTEDVATHNSLEEQVAALSGRVLQFIEPEKASYGMEDVDFTTLYLGEQIPAYEVIQGGLKLVTDVLYFPIMSENKWVATAFVTCDSDQNISVQISDEYAEDYAKMRITDRQVSLIFDRTSAYVFSGDEFIEAAKAPEITTDRVNVSEYKGLLPAGATLDRAEMISVEKAAPITRASFNNQKYLSVPLIKQKSGSMQCWAACIAAIRGYYGTSTTIDQVYNFANVTKYNGATVAKSKSVLEKYGFTVRQYYSDTFNWYQLRTEIYSYESPIFAGCKYNSSTGHAIVIRGYYVYENADGLGIIGYMDPATGKNAASSVSTDYKFYYVSSDNGKSYRITDFLAVSK